MTIVTASVMLIWQAIIPTMTCDANLCMKFEDTEYIAEIEGMKQNWLFLDYHTGEFTRGKWIDENSAMIDGFNINDKTGAREDYCFIMRDEGLEQCISTQ